MRPAPTRLRPPPRRSRGGSRDRRQPGCDRQRDRAAGPALLAPRSTWRPPHLVGDPRDGSLLVNTLRFEPAAIAVASSTSLSPMSPRYGDPATSTVTGRAA